MDKKSEIQAQICLLKCEKHEEQLESLHIEAMLASAEYVLCDAWQLWCRLPLEQKKRFNDLLFPEGIECSQYGQLRTPVTNAAIEVCDRLAAGYSPLAPHTLSGSNTFLVWLKRVYLFEQGLRAA